MPDLPDLPAKPHKPKVAKSFYTTREAADKLGVSVRTVQMWTESGMLAAWKTEGGHRRVTAESVDALMAKQPTGRIDERPAPAEGRGQLRDLVAQSVERLLAKRQQDAPIGNPPEAAAPLRVLVAEDDTDLLRVYEVWFKRLQVPYTLRTVTDGTQALIHLGMDRPDLFITDLNMPGMDALEVLRCVENLPELKDTVIVVATGLSAYDIQARGGLPERITVLQKPFSFQEIHRVALQLLARRSAPRPTDIEHQAQTPEAKGTADFADYLARIKSA